MKRNADQQQYRMLELRCPRVEVRDSVLVRVVDREGDAKYQDDEDEDRWEHVLPVALDLAPQACAGHFR